MFKGRQLLIPIAGAMALCLVGVSAAANYTGSAPAKDDAPAGKPKKEKRGPGAEIFDNKTVLPLRIQISSNELVALRKNERKDVRATVWEGTNVYRDVGLHIK